MFALTKVPNWYAALNREGYKKGTQKQKQNNVRAQEQLRRRAGIWKKESLVAVKNSGLGRKRTQVQKSMTWIWASGVEHRSVGCELVAGKCN